MKNYKTRTTTQNSAIHKYFELLAEAFNDAGYTQKHEIFSKVDLTGLHIVLKRVYLNLYSR